MNNSMLEFYVSMKDMMSGGLAKLATVSKEKFSQIQNYINATIAKNNSLANSFENVNKKASFGGAFGGLKSIVGVLGFTAVFAGIASMASAGIEKVHELHQSEAALENTMKNMGTYSKESFEKVISGSGKLSQSILFSKGQVIDLRSQLGLVGNIGQTEMERMIAVSADMATKFHTGLNEAGNALAKAVNNPEMMKRLAMQLKIDPAMVEYIQNLAKHGKEAQARLELIAIAEQKVGGAAAAAFNADPLARYNKTVEKMELTLGEAAIKVETSIKPIFMTFANTVLDASSSLLQFLGFNKSIPETLAAEQIGVNSLVGSILELNKGNGLRNTLLDQLKKSYPGLFDKIDIEKTTNSELLNILNDVNRSYERRISLSKNALEQQSLDKEQDYTMGIIGRAQQQLDYMKKGHTGFLETGMFSPYMEGFDNVQIRKLGFDEKSISGLQAFIDYGLKDVDRIQKSKGGILMEQKREENQGLLSDAQKVLNDGNLKGTLKNNFRDLIVTTLRKFNAGTAVEDDFGKLKSAMESASNIKKKKEKDLVDKDNSDNSITKGITGGGPRVININGVKFTDKIEIHSTTMGEGVGQLENKFQEMFLRILNSGASVQ